MSDKYTLELENFRSIGKAKVDIAPLTVVYGPNGAGKSSLIYGLLSLRNFLHNPNQNLPSLFSYPTMSLGGFEEVVMGHDKEKLISFSLSSIGPNGGAKFKLDVGQAGGHSSISVSYPLLKSRFLMTLEIPIPYTLNQSVGNSIHMALDRISTEERELHVTWNGIVVGEDGGDPSNREQVAKLLKVANAHRETGLGTAFIPLRRGFSTPTYSVSNVTPMLTTDAEVASLLAADRFLEYDVSAYVESISERRVSVRSLVGTSSFTVDSLPRDGGVPVSMVNDGFGINQLTHMLTLGLYSNTKIVAIEEPEIHLHPSIIRKLAYAMVDIASARGKRFIVSTHSEVFVLALLAQIAKGAVSVDDVSFILAEKEGRESRFTKQKAKPNGQIEGGIESFIASEFEDISLFLGLDSQK